jgi:DNA-binding beta-propeller fold protein YncE/cytochrome c peroxidase
MGFTMKKILASFLLTISLSLINLEAKGYRSPLTIVKSPCSKYLYVAEITGKKIDKINVEMGKIMRKYRLPFTPRGLVFANSSEKLYITGGVANGKLVCLDTKTGKIIKEIAVGHTPMSPQITTDEKMAFVCNRFNNNISAIDLKTGKEIKRIQVTREPIASVLSKDNKYLFVANHLPTGAANVTHMTSHIDIIDTEKLEVIKSIALPNGAIDLRAITISNDGEYVYVPSILARFLVPTSQIERGWINTHAFNIIRVKDLKLIYTVLLDEINRGAANPWGIICSEDDKYLMIVHSGTNEMSLINRKQLHEKLKKYPENNAKTLEEKEEYESSYDNPANEMSFLNGIRKRVKLPGIGARGIAAIGESAYITQYFTGDVAKVTPGEEVDDRCKIEKIPLGPKEHMDAVRKGEMYFNDATLCFQEWQACSTCHPDVRTDAVNWDLLNDGIGNPKSTKSLLFSHVTAPVMITGVRACAEVAVRAGIKYIQFAAVEEEKACDIDEYLKSLHAIPSPYLVDGKLSEAAKRGKAVFHKAKCDECHYGEYYTDNKMYDVKTTGEDEVGRKLNVPTLREAWRTAPYLYDGRAATMKDVFTKFNKENMHGDTKNLSEQEINDLVEYVNSL